MLRVKNQAAAIMEAEWWIFYCFMYYVLICLTISIPTALWNGSVNGFKPQQLTNTSMLHEHIHIGQTQLLPPPFFFFWAIRHLSDFCKCKIHSNIIERFPIEIQPIFVKWSLPAVSFILNKRVGGTEESHEIITTK